MLADLAALGVPAVAPVGYHNTTFMRDPEQRRTGRVAQVWSPTDGWVRELATLVRVSDAGAVAHRLAPAIGDATRAVLTILGYADGDIDRLCASGVVSEPSVNDDIANARSKQ
ncbi:MAG TPA: hypothetical protein PLV68_00375 [Ilumatobacteraceae bacterium]|nr:hypothetical protein [Ilumatobacteraceae bacterium]